MTEQLWDPIWSQWVADTGVLLQKLPGSLQASEQVSPLLHTFERWLLQLKVGLWQAGSGQKQHCIHRVHALSWA